MPKLARCGGLARRPNPLRTPFRPSALRWSATRETRLNRWILEQMRRLPEGGGYRFEPGDRDPSDPTNPRDPHYDGVSRPLQLGGRLVARAADDGATYCCGVTFEVWLEAWRARHSDDPEVGDPGQLVADWFCPVMGHPGVATALVERGLGTSVAAEDAQPGDFVQYWRSVDLAKPSGHSAVFLGWDEGPQGERVLRYWSSQPATGGIGVHSEVVGPDWELHFVRAD